MLFDGLLPQTSARDAGTYPVVFHSFSKPINVITAVTEKPFNLWQDFDQGACTNAIANLPGDDEQVQRTPCAITDRLQRRVHTGLGPTDQASTHPF